MRILLIDDERNIARMLSVALETDGHEVVAVESSSGALKQMQKTAFDAAFLDLRLGKEDGLTVLSQLRRADARLAVVIITAFASIPTAIEATRLGAADYLPKPFTPDQVRLALGRIEKSRGLERRVEELESLLDSSPAASGGLSADEFATVAAQAGNDVVDHLGWADCPLTSGALDRDRRRTADNLGEPQLDLFQSALLARREGRITDAASGFQNFIHDFVTDERAPVAAFELGRIRMDSMGDARGAVEALRLSLRLDSRAAYREEAQSRLVRALDELGQTAECEKARDSYLSQYPGGAYAQSVKSRCTGAHP